ncbi:hypothetical protein Naga_101876g1 [Nannochloropsis gaditana]|uniref:Uncharacterized protein n=1 Tax=Nannochloropsis gaditana TaxID=72520 RepID=W7TE70_9STRA|nr:hypothetical protein Naga_101876g1 [Nannochloropsis gaditana]
MRMTGKHEGCVFNGGTKEILNSKFWISGAYAGKSCKISHSWTPREGGRCWEGEKTKREVVGRQTTREGRHERRARGRREWKAVHGPAFFILNTSHDREAVRDRR